MTTPPPTSPLRAVRTALAEGAPTLDGVARRTGLARDVVRAAVDLLVRIGYVEAAPLAVGCPGGGCDACPSGRDGVPGCDGSDPAPASASASGRPVLVALTVRRPKGPAAG